MKETEPVAENDRQEPKDEIAAQHVVSLEGERQRLKAERDRLKIRSNTWGKEQ